MAQGIHRVLKLLQEQSRNPTCPPGYHHTASMATRELGHTMCGYVFTPYIVWPSSRVTMQPISSFNSKTRMSLKTQLLFYFLEHSDFPAFSLLEAAYRRTNSPRTVCILTFLSFVNMLRLDFRRPSRRPIFAVRPLKVYFSGCQFQNRRYNNSHETCRSFEVSIL